MVVESLAERWGPAENPPRIRFGGWLFNRFPAQTYWAGGPLPGRPPVLLMWPQTFMNRSGRAVGPAVEKLRIEPGRVVVVHDDVDLELGRVKVKSGGGAGGHRGLISIIEGLGGREFARVRCGIGRPEPGGDVVEHVLSPFEPEEEPALEDMLETAGQAVDALLRDGAAPAMNRFNRSNS
jgi:PTH1 family peptidyl-tRNA hydrolase